MITWLVGAISAAFSRPSLIAFAAASLWGVLSVFLSPCHMGAIPLVVAYINDCKQADRKRALLFSVLFALGLLAMLALVGVLTGAAGRILGDIGPAAKTIVSVFLMLSGLWLMDVPPFSRISLAFSVKPRQRGAFGALVLGFVYGIILGPCSFAFLAPMLGFVFSAGQYGLGYGVALMGFYALGHTAAIVFAGTFGDFIASLLRKKGSGIAATWFKRALGALVVLAGVLQIIG